MQEQGEVAIMRNKQHVDIWDKLSGTALQLCLGRGEELILLLTTSLQHLFLECRNRQILLYITKSSSPHPTLFSNEKHIHGASITDQNLITADQMIWLV